MENSDKEVILHNILLETKEDISQMREMVGVLEREIEGKEEWRDRLVQIS